MGYYDEICPGYDALHFEEQAEKARVVRGNCPLRGLLLDVGAGTGSVTRLFESCAECVALDPSKGMLANYPGLKVVARAEELPFKEASFDSVVSLTALHHCDLEKALGEIRRVSKGGAAIGISFFRRAKNVALAERLFSGFRKIVSGQDFVFVNP